MLDVETMSESSKMGLFGSKDKNKEFKKEHSTIEESPDRYAPYCIDSDSETYDTEALSIMDINDIIGVQSEPVSDSTLESEIAALSQIITDSKAESNQNIAHTKSAIDKSKDSNIICNDKSMIDDVDIDKLSESHTEKKCVLNINISNKHVAENVKLNRPKKEDLTTNSNNSPTSLFSSEFFNKDHSGNHLQMQKKSDVKEFLHDFPLSVTEIVVLKDPSTSTTNKLDYVSDEKRKSDTNNLVSVQSISESLQLIGEAYISEDSQETNLNDCEINKEQSVRFIKNSTIHNEDKKSEPDDTNNESQSKTNTVKSFKNIELTDITVEKIDSLTIMQDDKLKNRLDQQELTEALCIVESANNIKGESMNSITIDNNEEDKEEEAKDNIENRTMHSTNMKLVMLKESIEKEEPLKSNIMKTTNSIEESTADIKEVGTNMEISSVTKRKHVLEHTDNILTTFHEKIESINTNLNSRVGADNQLQEVKQSIDTENKDYSDETLILEMEVTPNKFVMHNKCNDNNNENKETEEIIHTERQEIKEPNVKNDLTNFLTNTKVLESSTEDINNLITETKNVENVNLVSGMINSSLIDKEDNSSVCATINVDTSNKNIVLLSENKIKSDLIPEMLNQRDLIADSDSLDNNNVISENQTVTTEIEIYNPESSKSFSMTHINSEINIQNINNRIDSTTISMNLEDSSTTNFRVAAIEVDSDIRNDSNATTTENKELLVSYVIPESSMQLQNTISSSVNENIHNDFGISIQIKKETCLSNEIKQNNEAQTQDNIKICLPSEVKRNDTISTQDDTKLCLSDETKENVEISKQTETAVCITNEIKDNFQLLMQDRNDACLINEEDNNFVITTQTETDACLSNETDENFEVSTKAENKMSLPDETKEILETSTETKIETFLSKEVEKDVKMVTQVETEVCLSNEADKNSEVSTKAENKMNLQNRTKEILETSTETKIETFLLKETEKDVAMIIQAETEVCLSNEADENFKILTESENKMSLPDETKEILEASTETEIETFLLNETEKDVAMIIQAETEVCLSKEADENFEMSTETEKMSLPDETKEILETSTETKTETFLLKETEKDVTMVMQAETEVCLSNEADENFEISTEAENKMSIPDETEEILETSTETESKIFLLKKAEKDIGIVTQAETEVCLSNEADENFEISTKAESEMNLSDEIKEILEPSAETEVCLSNEANENFEISTKVENKMSLSDEIKEVLEPSAETQSEKFLLNETDKNLEITTQVESETCLSDDASGYLGIKTQVETEACLSNCETLTQAQTIVCLSDQTKEILESSKQIKNKILTNGKGRNLEMIIQAEFKMGLPDDTEKNFEIATQIETGTRLSGEIRENLEILTQSKSEISLSNEMREDNQINIVAEPINENLLCNTFSTNELLSKDENRSSMETDDIVIKPTLTNKEIRDSNDQQYTLYTDLYTEKGIKEETLTFTQNVNKNVKFETQVDGTKDRTTELEEQIKDNEINTPNIEEKEEESDNNKIKEDTNLVSNIEEPELHMQINIQKIEENLEKMNTRLETVTEFNEHLSINVEDKNIDSKNTSENEINEINLTNTCLINDNVPKLLEDDNNAIEKPNIKNDLNKPDEEHNLRNILETTNNVVEIFSEEHCQNAQDIMASILSNVRNVDDFKSILDTEESTENEIEEVLRDSEELPLVDTEIKELAEKLPVEHLLHKDIEEPITAQNIDSLEGLLDLNLIPESEERILPKTKKLQDEIQEHVKTIQKNVDMTFLLKHPNDTLNISQDRDYITNVTTNKISEEKLSDHEPKIDLDTPQELLKIKENIIAEPSRKDTNNIDIQKQLEIDNNLQDNDLDMDFIENPLETVEDLENSKLEISQDILLGSTNQNETLNDTTTSMEAFQPSSEISELESAVKFLQESEEQIIDSPLILSPKMVESVVNNVSKVDDSDLFVPDEDVCEDASQLVAELQEIAADSISISEAEIISEAAKLETERKLAEHMKLSTVSDNEHNNVRLDSKKIEEQPSLNTISYTDMSADKLCNENMLQKLYFSQDEDSANSTKMTDRVRNIVESIPKISILEERLKEPPKIEIPQMEITKLCNAPSTPKDNLLIPKDAKIAAYQKMLESPKFVDNKEQKLIDTPRRDVEKHDFENVGSPRIILKIAKSAIADCSEPRSPKSPKIRSATNSPNPEDSPGQKLGKIKLKLSKSGHPSIISNENIDEISQWHSEGTASLSPIGMKIKLSKSGDALIVPSEKHESLDDLKEIKHKFEETKRTESPIGMKIKLSKSGDASIVQQDLKDITIKYKEKLDIQGSPKRTESPIGMKIKLSKTGDASIVQLDKQETHKEQKDGNTKSKEKIDITYELPKRTESPIGMKIKLSKSGDLSIIPTDTNEEGKDTIMEPKDKLESFPEIPKRTDSPIGMKIKLTKTKSGASIISMDNSEESKEKSDVSDVPKRIESPLGMKIKLSKSGDASIIHSEISDEPKEIKYKEKIDIAQDTTKQPEISSGVKIKVVKSGEASVITSEPIERFESNHDILQRMESGGMKIKIPKSSDALLIPVDKQEQIEEHKYRDIHQDTSKRTESPIGMKIKLSKTGDASIIQTDTSEDNINRTIRKVESEYLKSADTSLGMKIKLLKSNDNSTPESDRKEKQQKRRDVESPLEMKIKLSKTGHPTIIACDSHTDCTHKVKDIIEASHNFTHRYKDPMLQKDPALKILKTGHSTIVQSNRSELTIEPVQIQGKKLDNAIEISSKRKEITISPIESKKSKLEAQLSQILPEVTIQPVMSRDQKQLLFDPKTSLISRQQMNVISQEISITQVRPPKPVDMSMSEKLKNILCKNITNSPIGSDCEIIEHRPELIIVNENSNSSQDVMIIEEVPPIRMPEVKIPKKRGRPRRNPLPSQLVHPPQILMPRDPLALDEMPHLVQLEHRENERPKRTCRNQKSYAPPRRGRGRGRGKRKLESSDHSLNKKSRIEQDLTAIEASTMAIITIDESPTIEHPLQKSSELYKALKQSPADIKNLNPICKIEKQPLILVHKEVIKQSNIPKNILSDSSITVQSEPTRNSDIQGENSKIITNQSTESILLSSRDNERDRILLTQVLPQKEQKTMEKSLSNNKAADKVIETGKPTGHESKDILVPPGHSNWLTPTLKKQIENSSKNETITTVQVIDEETRMSAESVSRSQTPARNISMPASETIVNEESQGSVLSTATTESEKVKVKNRRMEINFDPDEGPFTVDKIAEYEWPLERKGETFMIQEQISQYLGVKSFKRKYPDLKRRMVDMEERNYLRENGLVSEAMCDMGLTAICSSEVLDVMCSDFPDQYEEYRKHMREKQIKEHSKKQKELTAAANAEKNRIDLAEMAVQSALSWNINLNKARKENRKCSLDLQSFTIHVPKKHQKIEMERKLSHYPVPLIPGQYTDYYREYTPAELRYYPLNTVLYGPMRPNERKFDSQSEGSQSDSDSDSSSDDSSSSSSEGTQDTEGSQSTMDDVDMEISNQKDESKLKCKMCLKILNKHSKNEVLIQCGTCNGYVHPSCIQLTLDMVPQIQSYAWQCTDCKTCAQCHDPADEAKMLFCDMCDRGYHIYCVGLRRVPVGRWHCQECAVCANCGSREPGGANSDRNSVAQWQHEFKKGDKNTRVYVSTLCVPCSKLWRKGRYCPHCSRCHTVPRLDLEANLVHCSACDKYLHLGCVETKGVAFDKKNYLCDFCTPNRQQLMKPLVSKVFKT